MLRYLNQVDFAPFGKILAYYPDGEGEDVSILSGSIDRLCAYNSEVCVDIMSGLCALCVCEQGDVCAFLLDKPVKMEKNCAFALAAVGGECVVRISPRTEPDAVVRLKRRFYPVRRAPHIEVRDVVTFFYQEREFGFRKSAEKHSFFELTYVDSGTIVNIVDGKQFYVNQGEIMLLFPGQTHIQRSSSAGHCSFITISFDMMLDRGEALKNKVFKADSAIRGAYSAILSEYEKADMYFTDMLAGYIHQIVLRLLRRAEGQSVSLVPLNPDEDNADLTKSIISNRLVRDAVRYIDTHLERKLSLSDVAEALRLNPSYTSRLFKEYTGVCVTEYIRRRKLGEAKRVLKAGGYTVTEISEMFGFSSIHYFSHCFKKEFGVSPADYANMLRV